MPAFHPLAHVAAPRIVRGEREDVVAAKLPLELREIPHAVTDVERRVVEIVLGKGFVHLPRDPRCRLRHELHQPECTAVGLGTRLKFALVLDDGGDEVGVGTVGIRTGLDVAAVAIGIDIAALHPSPAADNRKGNDGDDEKAQYPPESVPNFTRVQESVPSKVSQCIPVFLPPFRCCR